MLEDVATRVCAHSALTSAPRRDAMAASLELYEKIITLIFIK